MGRTPRNELYLDTDPDTPGLWTLSGYILSKRIRKQSRDIGSLETLRTTLEQQLAERDASRTVLRHTWLTADQLRDAEAAVQRAGAVRLLDCVIAAEAVLPAVQGIACTTALAAWVDHLRARKRFARTLEKNAQRIRQFLAFSRHPRHLTDLTPALAEAWVFRRGTEGYTPLTDATVLQAWLRFCVRRKFLALAPFEIDMKDLAESSKPVAPARILEPDQAGQLLAAAARHARGVMVPYVILTTWLRLRHAEALRTGPDQLKLDNRTPVVEVHPRKRRTASYRVVQIPAHVLPFLVAAQARGAFMQSRQPKGQRKPVAAPGCFFSKTMWETIRAAAGLIRLGPATRSKRRPILDSQWQENLLRHTGISYHHQKTGNMVLVALEAGNSDETAFRHYLTLPAEGAWRRFYSPKLVAPALKTYLAEAA